MAELIKQAMVAKLKQATEHTAKGYLNQTKYIQVYGGGRLVSILMTMGDYALVHLVERAEIVLIKDYYIPEDSALIWENTIKTYKSNPNIIRAYGKLREGVEEIAMLYRCNYNYNFDNAYNYDEIITDLLEHIQG